MKNNQPQLHVTATLTAQESITLHVISMNTKRIHTHWLVLVRGASSGFGRDLGGLRASAAGVACAVSLPVSPGSWALTPRPVILLQTLEVKVQFLKRGKKQPKPICSRSEAHRSTGCCLFAPSSCGTVAQVKVVPPFLLPALLGKTKINAEFSISFGKSLKELPTLLFHPSSNRGTDPDQG